MKVEVSNGEIADKITILMIKSEKASDPEKSVNIANELDSLSGCLGKIGIPADLLTSLEAVNRQLWDVEDSLREHEAASNFNEEFIALARSVYILNDRRARIKREINVATNSRIVEEKVLPDYDIIQ